MRAFVHGANVVVRGKLPLHPGFRYRMTSDMMEAYKTVYRLWTHTGDDTLLTAMAAIGEHLTDHDIDQLTLEAMKA